MIIHVAFCITNALDVAIFLQYIKCFPSGRSLELQPAVQVGLQFEAIAA